MPAGTAGIPGRILKAQSRLWSGPRLCSQAIPPHVSPGITVHMIAIGIHAFSLVIFTFNPCAVTSVSVVAGVASVAARAATGQAEKRYCHRWRQYSI